MATRLAGSWIGYHALVRPDHTALADLATGRRLGYRELDDRIGRLAGVLARDYGVAGDRLCAPGEPGELQISGASVTPGYWGRPAGTAQAIADGWLRTGDVATIGPGGHVRIVDRIKDMYISGGENVYPAEVEEALYQHPAVSQVAVVGAPDQRWGESGVAWLVLSPGAAAGPEDIRRWARTRLAAFKVPRDVRLVGELPRNATGKVLKAELRRRAAADGRPS